MKAKAKLTAERLAETHFLSKLTFDEMVSMVEKEPILSALILNAVNSVLIGIKRRVESLDDAISILGMTQVKNLLKHYLELNH